MAPRVSVICIFYNAVPFFTQAIESVLAQDYQDFELLLVDDGSMDGSTDIALHYGKSFGGRVRYLEHENHMNRGMSASRNLGLSVGRSEYVAFIDADDVWRPHKLRTQVELLDRVKIAGMVCGTVNYWRSWEGGKDELVATGHLRDAYSEPPATSLALYPWGLASAPCPSDVLVRRALAMRVGGFEEQFTGANQAYEDQPFFNKIYLHAPVYFSTDVWTDYRIHRSSFVATVHRAGQYGAVRNFFLDWFEAYLGNAEVPGKTQLLQAIRRSRWELAHPVLARVLRRLRLTLRSISRSG